MRDIGKRLEGYRVKIGGIQGKGWRDTGKRSEGYREKFGLDIGKRLEEYKENV